MIINYWPPALIWEDSSITDAHGKTNLFFIRVKDINAKDTIIHELEHVKQGWLGLFVFHVLLYRFVKSYRQWAEISAYKAALKEYSTMKNEYARRLMNPGYNFNLTYSDALELLK